VLAIVSAVRDAPIVDGDVSRTRGVPRATARGAPIMSRDAGRVRSRRGDDEASSHHRLQRLRLPNSPFGGELREEGRAAAD